MGEYISKALGAPPSTPQAGYVTLYYDGSWKYKNDAGTIFTLSTGITAEEVEDIVGGFFADSSTINVTYNDAGDVISADVVASAVDHDSLLNFVANEHIDHSTVSITAGTGLTGGGDLTASRSLSLSNVGTAGTYRSVTTDAQGRVTAGTNPTTLAGYGITDAQPLDSDLTAVAGLAGTGLISRTGTGTATTRTIVAGDTSLAVTNGDGVSGNPSLVVQTANINHNSLLNGGGNTHIDHSTVSITAGTYLSGGGDITATRTINHANSAVVAGSYGGVNAIPVLTIGATGHVDAASTVNPTAALLTGLGAGTNTSILATNTLLVALANLQAQVNALIATDNEWNELKTTADIIVNSAVTLTNVTELGVACVAGRTYYLEYTVIFRTAATTTGIALTVGTSDTAAGTLALQVNIPIAADGTAAGYCGNISALDDTVVATGVQTAQPTWFIANMKGVFICTTAGTLLPKFRSEVALSNVNFGTGSIALVREFT